MNENGSKSQNFYFLVNATSRATPCRGEEPTTRVRHTGAQDDATHTALDTDGDSALLASSWFSDPFEGSEGGHSM